MVFSTWVAHSTKCRVLIVGSHLAMISGHFS